MKKGFTLPEILVAVVIVAILAAMAVPQYEKAVEKSRKAEVMANLKKLYESKMRMIDVLEKTNYQAGDFGFENLDFTFPCVGETIKNGHRVMCRTASFEYYIAETSNANAVCAERRNGDQAGTVFVYNGDADTNKFLCKDSASAANSCDVYSMASYANSLSCSK